MKTEITIPEIYDLLFQKHGTPFLDEKIRNTLLVYHKPILSTKETAIIFSRSDQTIVNYANAKFLRGHQFTPESPMYFIRSELLEDLAKRPNMLKQK